MKQIYTQDNIQTAKAIYNYLSQIYKDRQIEWENCRYEKNVPDETHSFFF